MSAAATRFVVLIPAVAALVGLLLARRIDPRVTRFVAVGASLLAVVAALLQVVAVHGTSRVTVVHTIPALDAGELRIPLQLQVGTCARTTGTAPSLPRSRCSRRPCSSSSSPPTSSSPWSAGS